jgi:hypothetical protein
MYISAGGGGQDGKAAVQRIGTVVVYDVSSGRVVHTHHAVTFAGGTSLSDDELKERALKLSQEALTGSGRRIPTRLDALQVDPASVAPGVEYKVDPKQRVLLAGKAISLLAKQSAGSSKKKLRTKGTVLPQLKMEKAFIR